MAGQWEEERQWWEAEGRKRGSGGEIEEGVRWEKKDKGGEGKSKGRRRKEIKKGEKESKKERGREKRRKFLEFSWALQ